MFNSFRNNLRPWQFCCLLLFAVVGTCLLLWLLGSTPRHGHDAALAEGPPAPQEGHALRRAARPHRKTAVAVEAARAAETTTAAAEGLQASGDRRIRHVTMHSAEEYQRMRDWATANGFALVGEIPQLKVLRFALTPSEYERLRRDSGLDFAEEEEILVCIPDLLLEPYPEWHGNPGPGFGSTYREYLGVDTANPERGQGTTIALLDTAILEHPALATANLKVITGGDSDEILSDHGTAVASILTGEIGVSNAQVIAYEVIDSSSESGSVFALAEAIVDAVEQGANVISLSLGTYEDSAILSNAVNYALSNQVLVVAAAGNNGVGEICYPAAYDGVIAVGAIDANGNVSGFSNSGEEITLVAPGVGLQSATYDGEYAYFSGTSAAVPCVAAVLANYLAENPSGTPEEAVAALVQSCNDTEAPGPDELSGFGILDAGRLATNSAEYLPDAAAAGITYDPESNILTVSVQNTGTTTLEKLRLVTQVQGAELVNEFSDLPPGGIASAQGALPAEVWEGGATLTVRTTVATPGVVDMRTRNQTHLRVIDAPQ